MSVCACSHTRSVIRREWCVSDAVDVKAAASLSGQKRTHRRRIVREWMLPFGDLPVELRALIVVAVVSTKGTSARGQCLAVLGLCLVNKDTRRICETHKDAIWKAAATNAGWWVDWNTGLAPFDFYKMMFSMEPRFGSVLQLHEPCADGSAGGSNGS